MSARSSESPKSPKSLKSMQSLDKADDEKMNEAGETDEPASSATLFQIKLSGYTSKLSDLIKEMKELQSIGKTIEKDFNTISKNINKSKKGKKSTKARPLSGFAVPSALSQELYEFLNITKGEMVPRKDVTKMINDYIKANECRDEKDKRKILPDAALKAIFNCGDDDNITYFNLQTYMKHHYIKNT